MDLGSFPIAVAQLVHTYRFAQHLECSDYSADGQVVPALVVLLLESLLPQNVAAVEIGLWLFDSQRQEAASVQVSVVAEVVNK